MNIEPPEKRRCQHMVTEYSVWSKSHPIKTHQCYNLASENGFCQRHNPVRLRASYYRQIRRHMDAIHALNAKLEGLPPRP
jgi:hypothetical protein